MKISVWDDDTSAAEEWKSALDVVLHDSGAHVHASTAEEIEHELRILHVRRKWYLESDEGTGPDHGSGLDDTDVLVVDNDLFDLPTFNDLSAETVAIRAGIYTDCACIIVLNVNPDLDFDLTLLGHPESKADLHINDRFVADLGLWRQCPKENGLFRPWHWPLVFSAVDLYRSRVRDLVMLLDSDQPEMPILDYFRFGDYAKMRLSRAARAFLHPNKRAEEISFIGFMDGNARAVSHIDGEKILGHMDVRKIARIGARRISKWLGQHVLGPQDLLMDFPHLIEKMPFVVPDDKQECGEFWNSCAKLEGAPVELVEQYGIEQFGMEAWFDRPVFWADGMETEENIRRLLEATETNPGGLVFCEDSSAFHVAEDCAQFVAAHNSISDSRFVRWLREEGEEVRYGPQSRLAM